IEGVDADPRLHGGETRVKRVGGACTGVECVAAVARAATVDGVATTVRHDSAVAHRASLVDYTSIARATTVVCAARTSASALGAAGAENDGHPPEEHRR